MAIFKIMFEDVEGEVKVVSNAAYLDGEQQTIPTKAILVGEAVLEIIKETSEGKNE